MESLIRHCVAALRAFARSQHGNIVITFAIASPVVIGVTAIGVD